MEAFFVVVLAAVMFGVAAVALLAVRRTSTAVVRAEAEAARTDIRER